MTCRPMLNSCAGIGGSMSCTSDSHFCPTCFDSRRGLFGTAFIYKLPTVKAILRPLLCSASRGYNFHFKGRTQRFQVLLCSLCLIYKKITFVVWFVQKATNFFKCRRLLSLNCCPYFSHLIWTIRFVVVV